MFRSRHKAVQLMVKTHKEMTFNEAKDKVLSALTQFPNEKDVPTVSSIDDFEICVGRKTKKDTGGDGTAAGGHKLEFEIIDGQKRMRDVFSKPWEVAYVKFRNTDGTLRPVQVKFATLVEDDADEEAA